MRLGSGHLGALVALSLATGCLYTDTINAPPRAALELTDPNAATGFRRGDTISYNADKSADPDDDALFYDFEAEACAENYCLPIDELAADRVQLSYLIPYRVGPDGPPTTRVRTYLTVTDGRGAFATTFEDEILDTEPRLVVQVAPSAREDNTYAVDEEIIISARVDGGELASEDFELDWTISDRPSSSQTDQLVFEELTGPMVLDPTYRLVPDVAGAWEVTVTATDSSGESTAESKTVVVVGDQPACITVETPSVSLTHLLQTTDAPRVFEVIEVVDEFDPFPYDDYSQLEFRWLVSENGSAFTEVGATAGSFTINPALYSPGDDLEVRVEILDASRDGAGWPGCADDQASCSEAGDGCTQRQTWTVGIR
ncbi:MAG: hypothetical protein KJO07_18720 [Deltaproteobacteria bacterium]|nr:hypothetical protein [Deltaproteobacteria bacterium]